MQSKIANKVLSVILSVSLMLQMGMPVVYAEKSNPIQETKTITAFADLAEDIKTITVPVGTAEVEILTSLPETVTATVVSAVYEEVPIDSSTGETQSKTEDVALAVTWKSDKTFSSETANTFIYTAQLTDSTGYTLAEDVTMPNITVTVYVPAYIASVPMVMLAEGNTYTETRFGLTVTQTGADSQGFTLGAKNGDTYAHVYDAHVSITQSGTYTISGTYNDTSETGSTFTGWFVGENPYGMRGIIDVSNAPEGSNITLILDNITIETDYWQTPPILLRRQAGGADTINVTIQLKGSNLLANNAGANGGGAIVKQDGTGSLTFIGDGSLTAKARDVAIGAPIIYYGSDNWVSSNCTNITFAQTGSITAEVLLGTGTPVGVSGEYQTGTASVTASNITVENGTLNLINTYSGTLGQGAMLGASGRFNYFSNIQITGGKITTSTPNATIGSKFYSIGGYSMENSQGVHISGGTIVSSLQPYAQDTRMGDYAYGTYIATSDAVSSLSAKVDGEDYIYTANGVESQSGKVWLWLPAGNAAVTLNGTTYYGVVDSSNNTELKQSFNPVTGITGLPAEMNANSTITLAGAISPTDATFTNISKYEILDAGTTGATLSGSSLTASAGGTVRMQASVAGGGVNSETYTQEFSVAVSYTAVTDITGIPDSLHNGTTITLTPSFIPSDASYKTIAWSVKSGSATLSGSRLSLNAPGTVVLTATVANGSAYGTAYTEDFTIMVPYTPVTDITATIPSTLSINEGLSLSGAVAPSDASYRIIAWSVEDAGVTSAAITGNTLKATAAGILTLRATVKNGLGEGQDFTKNYTIQVFAADSMLDINVGSITITQKDSATNTVSYAGYSGGSKDVPKSETIVVSGNNTGNKITVDVTTAKILLQDVSLTSAGNDNCIDLKNGASLTLLSSGSNTLTATGGITGISSATIHVPAGTALTMEDGGGGLSVVSNRSAAIGGNCISSGNGETAGTIIINGGVVMARSQYGAALGGGYSEGGTAGAGGSITIRGGIVTANSDNGAALGGGYSVGGTGGAGGSITITGGTVTATSNSGAGIGGGGSQDSGTGGAGGTISISGGIVTATNTYWGAAIGGGCCNGSGTAGAGGTVIISGGTVMANAKEGWGTMAIGGGMNNSYGIADNGTLKITGGSVITNRSITGGEAPYIVFVSGARQDKSNTCIFATSDGTTPVYYTTADVSEIYGNNVSITNASIKNSSYGFNDVKTDASGVLHLYLPVNADNTKTIASFNGATYGGTITSTESSNVLKRLVSLTASAGTLTGIGAELNVTSEKETSIYYVKATEDTTYSVEDGNTVESAAVTAGNQAINLTDSSCTISLSGLSESTQYTYYLVAKVGSTYSDVVSVTFKTPLSAPNTSDVSVDYANELLKAKSGLDYTLEYALTSDAAAWTEVTTDGVRLTSVLDGYSGTDDITLYVHKKAGSDISEAVFFMILARPSCTVNELTIDYANETVTIPKGIAYQFAQSAPSTWTSAAAGTGSPVTLNPGGGSTSESYISASGTADGSLYKVYLYKPATGSTFGSKTVSMTIPARPATPAAPAATIDNIKDTSIRLNSVIGAEYSKDGTIWQDGTEFTGLASNANQTFYQRIKATAGSFASTTSSADIKTTKTPIADATVTFDNSSFTYTGSSQTPTVTVKLGDITLLADTDYTVSYSNSNGGAGNTTNAGTITVIVTATESGCYSGTAISKPTYNIVQSGTTFEEGIKTFNGNTEATTFTYGDTITVKVTPKVTGTASAADGLWMLSSFSAPAANQMALFAGEKQITEPVNATDGVYTMTYDTKAKDLVIGDNTITAKYVGNRNMADYCENVIVTLNKKAITSAVVNTSDAYASREYNGTASFEGVALTLKSSDILSGDTVTATADGIVTDVNVGTGKAFTATSVTLSGVAVDYYSLDKSEVSGNVEIKHATIVGVNQELQVLRGLAKEYTFDLTKLLPELSEGKSFGNITYTVGTVTNTDNVLAQIPANENVADGKITLKVASVTDKDKIAAIQIKVASKNYKDFTADLKVKTIDKTSLTLEAVFKGGIYTGKPYTYTGRPTFKNGTESVPGINYTAKYAGRDGTIYTESETAPKDAGKYNLILTVSGESTNTYAGTAAIGFEITKKQITAKPNDVSIESNASLPVFAWSIDTGIAGETITATNAKSVVMEVQENGKKLDTVKVGTFDIVFTTAPIFNQKGDIEKNYDIQIGKGKLTVTKHNSSGDSHSDGGSSSRGSSFSNDKGNSTPSTLSSNLPKATVDALVKAGTKEVRINSGAAEIKLDLETLKTIQKQVGEDVNVSAKKIDNSTLSDEVKAVVGNRPVFDITITGTNGKKVTNFGKGKVSVSIPYTLGANEKAENVVAYYIDNEGKVHEIPNSVYDEKSKTLTFVTDHFSKYGVGYKLNKATTFTDIANHWAKNEIEFAAARGFFSGTGGSKFSPDMSMTRGMFVTTLGRLAKVNPESYNTTKFTDVKADSCYLPYIEWASKNGIVKGTPAATFGPDQSVTREQMAVIMANYAKTIGFEFPKLHAENIFADDAKIASFAKLAVKQMQMAGIISGKSGNRFDPQGTATRAEVAVVFKRFTELVGKQ